MVFFHLCDRNVAFCVKEKENQPFPFQMEETFHVFWIRRNERLLLGQRGEPSYKVVAHRGGDPCKEKDSGCTI